jgi:hypothetical protein
MKDLFFVKIKDYHSDDEWDECSAFDDGIAAQEIAEKYYNEEPCRPDEFEIEVTVKMPIENGFKYSKFMVTAYDIVGFSARKVP